VSKLVEVNKTNGINNEKFFDNHTVSYASYSRDDNNENEEENEYAPKITKI